MNNLVRSACLNALVVILSLDAGVLAAQCPNYTKNRDSTEVFAIAEPTLLPTGFVLFRRPLFPGVYHTPLATYDPTLVPGTDIDEPYSISLSDDGEWVFYINKINEYSAEMVIQRIDGTGRATLPQPFSYVGGFYRESPMGEEIFFLKGNSTMKAMQVDLSGETAAFLTNTERTMADIGYEREFDNSWSGSICVVGNQIFGRENGFVHGIFGRTAFITIPDSGRGTATTANIHPWANDDTAAVWGCGHTMSHDGAYCLANSSLIGSACSDVGDGAQCLGSEGSVGGSGCIPNRRSVLVHTVGTFSDTQHFDHKGFYITRFWGEQDPIVELDDIVDSLGISINWAPPQYRKGEFDEVDFTSWQFSNDSRYVAGVLKGTALRALGIENGIWVVEWESNTWARITPDTTTMEYDDPALFISDAGATRPARAPGVGSRAPRYQKVFVSNRALAQTVIPAWAREVAIFTADGKRVWFRATTTGHNERRLDWPSLAGNNNLLIVHYR